jgi:hypothetical protein
MSKILRLMFLKILEWLHCKRGFHRLEKNKISDAKVKANYLYCNLCNKYLFFTDIEEKQNNPCKKINIVVGRFKKKNFEAMTKIIEEKKNETWIFTNNRKFLDIVFSRKVFEKEKVSFFRVDWLGVLEWSFEKAKIHEEINGMDIRGEGRR